MSKINKDPYSKKVEKKLSLKSSSVEYITNFWAENDCSSFSDAVDKLVHRDSARENDQLSSDVIASLVADKVAESLTRTYLDPIRIRTGYADKQTKALLEVMNHLVVKNGWDGPNIVTTDIRKSNVLTVSEEKITKQIEHFKQNKATREAQRKMAEQ